MSTITERLLERHRVDSERMWPAPSDLDLLAAARIKELEGALREIDYSISGFELTMTLPRAKELKAIWNTARAALQPKEPK